MRATPCATPGKSQPTLSNQFHYNQRMAIRRLVLLVGHHILPCLDTKRSALSIPDLHSILCIVTIHLMKVSVEIRSPLKTSAICMGGHCPRGNRREAPGGKQRAHIQATHHMLLNTTTSDVAPFTRWVRTVKSPAQCNLPHSSTEQARLNLNTHKPLTPQITTTPPQTTTSKPPPKPLSRTPRPLAPQPIAATKATPSGKRC